MGIFQPWDKTNYEVQHPATVVFDMESQETILRIPVVGLRERQIKDLYELARQQYLLGYSQGVDDKRNELRAVLGCY